MTGTRCGLELLQQYVKRITTKSQKVSGANPTFVEVTGETLVGALFASLIMNRVNDNSSIDCI